MFSQSRQSDSRGGFALVIALSLMAFILLLLLSITTLVRVETVTSVNRMSLERAKANAQLGVARVHLFGPLIVIGFQAVYCWWFLVVQVAVDRLSGGGRA